MQLVEHRGRLLLKTPNLKTVRLRKKVSQEELARRIGVSFATVNRIERGHHTPHLDTAKKLARALGVSLSELAEPVIVSDVERN